MQYHNTYPICAYFLYYVSLHASVNAGINILYANASVVNTQRKCP